MGIRWHLRNLRISIQFFIERELPEIVQMLGVAAFGFLVLLGFVAAGGTVMSWFR